MTGNEMLEYLKGLPSAALEQEVIFEVLVAVAPEEQISGHVPVVEAYVAHDDQLLTPDGLVTPDEAMKTYIEYQEDVTAGICTEEDIRPYMPFFCHKILSKDQVIMKLQGIRAYTETPKEEAVKKSPMAVSWNGTGQA